MADDRDKRRALTPPPGVAAQLARAESWEGQRTGVTPVHGVPTETPMQTVVRRSGETKNIALDVHGEVAAIAGRVGTLELELKQVASAVEAQGEQNEHLIRMTSDVIGILKNQSTVSTTTQLAVVDVTTKRAMTENDLARERGLAEIADMTASNALKRSWQQKTFEKFALPILAAIATYLAVKLAGG